MLITTHDASGMSVEALWKRGVLRLCHQHEILRAIVGFVSVEMVHDLGFQDRPTDGFFGY